MDSDFPTTEDLHGMTREEYLEYLYSLPMENYGGNGRHLSYHTNPGTLNHIPTREGGLTELDEFLEDLYQVMKKHRVTHIVPQEDVPDLRPNAILFLDGDKLCMHGFTINCSSPYLQHPPDYANLRAQWRSYNIAIGRWY